MTTAREVAFRTVLSTFRDGERTDEMFRKLASELDPQARGTAKWLVYGTVKQRDTLDASIATYSDRSLRKLDPEVLNALRLALFELQSGRDVAPHAVVNETVEMMRRNGLGRASGFVNAVLRRALRSSGSPVADVTESERAGASGLARRFSFPLWLSQLWCRELGADDARALMQSLNLPAESALRINRLSWTPDEAARAGADIGIDLTESRDDIPLDPFVYVADGAWDRVEAWIRDGKATPQSRGSAAAVAVLDPQPGDHVLEIAAGPGTKSGQIAERLMGRGEVMAIEPDRDRAKQVAEQMERLAIANVTIAEVDAQGLGDGSPAYDRVLVDPPCSDLGALASRPDARWRKSPRMIEELSSLQAALVRAGFQNLRSGGRLVYSTCTISEIENAGQIGRLEAEFGAAIEVEDLGSRYPSAADRHDERCLQILPHVHGTTGFFIASVRRR